MPSRNRVKSYLPESYYHVYNRGVEKRRIFLDEEDNAVFLNLLKRYLDVQPHHDAKKREYVWLHDDIELLAFCLMPNHFHLLVYQIEENALKKLMMGVGTSYTTFFNKKYQRVGPLFQDRYKASLITSDSYNLHISRYIHRNPKDFETWQYSSLPFYYSTKKAGWLNPDRVLELFEGQQDYKQFMHDDNGFEESLNKINQEIVTE